jgi:periplasmic divalent cation tolerance protein
MSFMIAYVTNKDQKSASKLAGELLRKRLITCANFLPIKSSYWWKGKLVHASEVVSLLKTRNENWKRLREEVERIHPYETPCIIRLNAHANKAFEDWIKKESKQTKQGRHN